MRYGGFVCVFVLLLLGGNLLLLHRMLFSEGQNPMPPAQQSGPWLSIVILTYNNSVVLNKQLNILLKQVEELSLLAEVVLVDNGCLPLTQAVLLEQQIKHYRSVKRIDLCRNLPYAAANNAAVFSGEGVSASAKWILFLNDDVLPKQGMLENFVWLERVLRRAVDWRPAGVACKLMFESGARLMEAGSLIRSDGSTDNFLRDAPSCEAQGRFSRVIHYGSAACLFVEREAFLAAKGFNEKKYPAYFEDTHLQMELTHTQGRLVLYSPVSQAEHLEHATFGSSAAMQLMAASREEFAASWSTQLTQLHPDRDSLPRSHGALSNELMSRDSRSKHASRVLFVVHAGALHTRLDMFYEHLLLLQGSGMYLLSILLSSAHEARGEIGDVLRVMGVEVLVFDSKLSSLRHRASASRDSCPVSSFQCSEKSNEWGCGLLSHVLDERRGYYHVVVAVDSMQTFEFSHAVPGLYSAILADQQGCSVLSQPVDDAFHRGQHHSTELVVSAPEYPVFVHATYDTNSLSAASVISQRMESSCLAVPSEVVDHLLLADGRKEVSLGKAEGGDHQLNVRTRKKRKSFVAWLSKQESLGRAREVSSVLAFLQEEIVRLKAVE